VDWDALGGKLVILEFWATWCGPCVAAIPHLKELAAEFKDEPLQIIAITDEDRATVEAFLKEKPMSAWIGVGASKDTHTAYGVHGIPHTVIVSPNGKILGVTHPAALQRDHIAALLRGESVSFPSMSGGIRPGELPSVRADRAPLFQVLIQESVDSGLSGGSASNRGGLTMIGTTLDRLIEFALDATPAEIDIEVEIPETRYDVVCNFPDDSIKSHEMFVKELIENTFQLEFEQVDREIEVDVLSRIPGAEPKLTPSNFGSLHVRGSNNGLQFTSTDIHNVVANLANVLKHPVIDETGIGFNFDARLTFDPSNAETLRNAVRDSMGLQLVPERRIASIWVVRGATKD
jgi:uncharacterized protein (TIGR03435 family)